MQRRPASPIHSQPRDKKHTHLSPSEDYSEKREDLGDVL